MQTKSQKLDNFQNQLFRIYLLLLKTHILPEELQKIEDELYTANKMYKYDKEIMASLIEKAIVIDENTVQVIWKNQDMYDKVLSNL